MKVSFKMRVSLKMSENWKTYLLWFVQEHIEFRLPEIHSLLSLFNIEMKFVQESKDIEPFWLVQFRSESDVKLLASRSVSIRNCLELWGHANNLENLHEQLKQLPAEFVRHNFRKEVSFKIEVETFCRHFTQKEKVDKIETFSYLPAEGPVNLSNPDVVFQYIEYYGTDSRNPPEAPHDVFFGKLVASGLRQLIKKLTLKTRKFIGNTSMDPQLSLLMANQAKVKNNDLIVDPFVGSGSLLVAAAEFGGYVWGGDIDYMMLHARTRPSRISQKKRDCDESIKANMEQYNLQDKYLDVMVNDFTCNFWRDSLKFDAIITDPPYGIREATEKIGTNKQNPMIKEEYLSTHIPAKVEYTISNMFHDLLLFSAKHLTNGGRLVCWFPVFREDYSENVLPSHPCLKIVANSEQVLSKVTSRRLLTFEKIREPEIEEVGNGEIMDFREKYFVVREESRKERRMREASKRKEEWEMYKKQKENLIK